MENIVATVENGELVMRVKLNHNAEVSKSGKTKLLASSGGFQSVSGGPDGLKISVNVSVPLNFTPATGKKK